MMYSALVQSEGRFFTGVGADAFASREKVVT